MDSGNMLVSMRVCEEIDAEIRAMVDTNSNETFGMVSLADHAVDN